MKQCCFLLGFSLLGIGVLAAQTSSGPMLRFTATAANVSGAPDSIRIDLLRWSTDAERDKLMAAWDLKPGAVAPEGGASGGRGGRGGAAVGRGGAAAGRGGRGSAGGPGPERAKPMTPERSLAVALQQATTVGYVWSSEVAGYAIRYAGKVSAPDGSERIILITDRRLGENNHEWDLKGNAAPSNYGFSVIELRINAKGEGEGRVTLTGQVAPDPAVGMVAPVSYEALPVVLTKVKRDEKRN
jgi:hypothetical protein